MIRKLEVVRYPRGPGGYTADSSNAADWQIVIAELQTMDPFEKPLLTLQQHADIPDADLMMVCGGNGVYHVQVADSSSCWLQAVNPFGSDEIIVVWTSDQGFSCERKFTWNLAAVTQLVQYYFEYGKPHPEFCWE